MPYMQDESATKQRFEELPLQCNECGNRMSVDDSVWRKVMKVQYRTLECECGHKETTYEVFGWQYSTFMWTVSMYEGLLKRLKRGEK